MARRNPEEILSVLEQQALEDEMREIAKMSDADLDEELRRAGVDPQEAIKSAPAAPGAPLSSGSASASAMPLRRRMRGPVAWTGGVAVAAALAMVFVLKRDKTPFRHVLNLCLQPSKF